MRLGSIILVCCMMGQLPATYYAVRRSALGKEPIDEKRTALLIEHQGEARLVFRMNTVDWLALRTQENAHRQRKPYACNKAMALACACTAYLIADTLFPENRPYPLVAPLIVSVLAGSYYRHRTQKAHRSRERWVQQHAGWHCEIDENTLMNYRLPRDINFTWISNEIINEINCLPENIALYDKDIHAAPQWVRIPGYIDQAVQHARRLYAAHDSSRKKSHENKKPFNF